MCIICALNNPSSLVASLDTHTASALPSAANPGEAFWAGQGAVFEIESNDSTGLADAMTVGQTMYGTLSSSTDTDFFSIQLVAGVTYDFRQLGYGEAFLTDPLIRLFDNDNIQIAFDDDGFTSGSNTHELDSALTFTATYTGNYYISADAFSTQTGDYIVTATVHDVAGPIFTVDEMAWQLINNGEAFFEAVEAAAFDVGVDLTITVNLSALTAEGQFLALEALQAWSAVTGINFADVAGAAEIMFDDNQSGAFADFTSTGAVINDAYVNVGTDWLAQFGTTLDSYSFETYIHEIGHAIGLGHGGNYNGSANYGIDNFYINDSLAWSIMSYMQAENDEFAGSGVNTYVGADFRYIFTPQIVDILAIQELYGTFTGAFVTNTVYGFGGNTGFAAIDGAASSGASMAMTIYDNGGSDRLNFSLTSANQLITLAAESLSSVLGGQHNLGIARGVTIENAIAGAGNDFMFGNAVSNSMSGGSGFDTITGFAGSDRLYGDGGGDYLDGGQGHDSLYGGTGNDYILGQSGNDNIFSGSGDDNLISGTGSDSLQGTTGNDIMNGGAGADYLYGGSDNDRMQGATDADSLFGGDGNDIMAGGDGNDLMRGGAGADTMSGNAGADDFQFMNTDQADRINGYEKGIDDLFLDDALWGGGLTAQQVVTNFATINGTGTIITFNFGGGDVLQLQNVVPMTLAGLAADISII